MGLEKQPEAIDLSHHLSDVALARRTSPLKGLAKYMGKPGIISLAGGLPNPGYFPFSSLSADTLVVDSFPLSAPSTSSSLSWFWKLLGAGSSKEKTATITIPKYAKNPQDVNLSTALQYGTATGLQPLQKFINDFTAKVYQPGYSNFATLAQTGNTDGWSRAASTLCNPGELILTEEWTYPSALANVAPMGLSAVPVKMDKEGMRSDSLRKILSEWDETASGRRPHVLYTVPVGQNPSGATMEAARKQEIYDICVEFDVIIVEDDPYFFLQEGPYLQKSERYNKTNNSTDDIPQYISSLAPSYLKFDTQGRVVRLDTFSKTIAPGSRLGWFTCNPLFAERLERAGEVSTQAPCGFGQSLIAQLLISWTYEGYIRWLRGLGAQYTVRRDYFIDSLVDEFDLKLSTCAQGSWEGCDVYDAYAKRGSASGISEKSAVSQKPIFSFVPPTSGMFVWLKVHFDNHPSFSPDDESFEIRLWVAFAEAGLLISPGWFFAADTEHSPDGPKEGHYRISFSFSEFEDLKKGTQVFGQVVRKFFQEA